MTTSEGRQRVLESPDYRAARERLQGNPVISMMAAGVVTVPLAELADEDGTPRSHLMNQANRGFDDAEARNAGNPGYTPYPKDAHRHLGLIAEAILAERAAMRAAVAAAMAPPGTDPESGVVTSIIVRMRAGESAVAIARETGAVREPGPGEPGRGRPVTENQPARRPAAAGSDWQDIYLRDTDGGTDVMFDGGVSGWPIHVTGNDLRLLLARLLDRAGARYEVHGDGRFTRAARPGRAAAHRADCRRVRPVAERGGLRHVPRRGGRPA